MVTAFIVTVVAVELIGAGISMADAKKGSGITALVGIAVSLWGIATLMVHLGAL